MPASDSLSTPLAYALAYAAIGWHVLPLEPSAKQPLGRLVPRGMLDATTDPETIRGWWRKHPAANIGIALAQSGLVAIDVDPRNGGTETFEQLQAAHGSLRSEVMAFTGGAGEHHLFVIPPGAQISLPGTLGPGVDLKANGYVVAEPSIHPSGKRYGWEASSSPLDGTVPSPLPDWLRSLRVDLQQPTPRAGDVPVDPAQAQDAREALYLMDADSYEEWLHAGMALHSTKWGHPAYAMWCAWSQQSTKFDSTVCRRKWESFTSDAERGDIGITLSWIFGNAQARGWRNPRAGTAPRLVDSTPRPGLPLVFAETITSDHVKIDQLVEDIITRGGLSVMYGESNSGKSFLACDMGCSVGAAATWLGKRTVRGAVVYVAGEGAESIKMRVLAWRQKHGIDTALAIIPAAVNLLDKNADLQRIVDACQIVERHYGMPVGLVVVDTLARAFGGGNENSSEDMGCVISHADMIRAKTMAHVMFVHHSGKDIAKGSRGHSSLKAATDTEIEVTADDEKKLHTAEITKQRDLSSRGEKVTGKFTIVRMGVDQWGKPVTTCVVEPTDEKPTGPSTRKRGGELRMAIASVLAAAPNRTMKRAVLVKALTESGFTTSPIYRSFGEMAREGVTTESMGSIHLNNMPTGEL